MARVTMSASVSNTCALDGSRSTSVTIGFHVNLNGPTQEERGYLAS